MTLPNRFEVALIGRNWWVKSWSEGYRVGEAPESRHGLWNMRAASAFPKRVDVPTWTPSNQRNTFYIVGCILISLATSLLGTFKFFWTYIGSLRASRNLSESMANAVIHAPLRWLDTVPTGRILNRFLADFNTVDSILADDLVLLAYYTLQLLGIIIAAALVSPFLLLFAGPLVALCVWCARQYLAGARDLKRLGKSL